MNSDYIYCNLVKITVDAYSSCLNHALLTDQEEVMGLLIGNVQLEAQVKVIYIFSTICLTRNCKQKDRVEFDEIQISKACEIADELTREFKVTSNVVGWYHSHPKITIPPSNVDLNTQHNQQYQGDFVGLIIACFNNDGNNINKINLIAFQTKKDTLTNVPHFIPIEFINESEIFANNLLNSTNSAQTYASILKNLLSEEENQFQQEKAIIEKDDYVNYLLLLSSRQGLLCKIIQNVSSSYVQSVNSEIENLRNYLLYVKDLNNNLKKMVKNYEDINKFKEQDS